MGGDAAPGAAARRDFVRLGRGTVAAAVVLLAGAVADHALIGGHFAAAAERAGNDLGRAEAGGLVAAVGRVVLALALALLAAMGGLAWRRSPARALLIGSLAWILAYPILLGQLVLFGVLPGRVAALVAGVGLLQFAGATLAAAWAMAPRQPKA